MDFVHKFWLVFAVANLLFIDGAIVGVDDQLRQFRNNACVAMQANRGKPTPAREFGEGVYWTMANNTSTYEIMRIEFTDTRGKWDESLHLYGCDANGHRYRMWIQKGNQ